MKNDRLLDRELILIQANFWQIVEAFRLFESYSKMREKAFLDADT